MFFCLMFKEFVYPFYYFKSHTYIITYIASIVVLYTFAYLYYLDDDSERPMAYETSLLPKVFPL